MTTLNLANQVDAEGRSLAPKQERLSPTSIKVSWTVPATPIAYAGVIVVASPQQLNPSNFPTNTVRYTGSSSWTTPADMIGLAHVVGAFYDDMTTNSVTITDLEPDTAIYIAVHMTSDVFTYYIEGARTYPEDGLTTAWAGRVPSNYGPPENPVVGQVYYDPDQKMMFVWDGATWLTTKEQTVPTAATDPVPPISTDPNSPNYPIDYVGYGRNALPPDWPLLGNFFYNTTTRTLKTWTGVNGFDPNGKWNDNIETKRGEPTYAELDVGTTGEPTARETIKNILKYQLGYPVVCVELVDEHFEIAINNALQELRRRVDSAYYKQYFFMTIMRQQDVYYLNDRTLGLDHVVDVLKIHRLNMLGLVNWGPDNLYAQQFLNQFYAPGVGYDLVSIHLIHSLSELYSQLFAGEIAFNWREARRELRIYRSFGHNEKVLLECSMEKPEQEILVDRWLQQWVQQWAEAELMMILANIRGKYASLPGPGGGLQLNAAELRAEGQRLQEDCLRQVKDYEVGQNGPENWYPPFIIG